MAKGGTQWKDVIVKRIKTYREEKKIAPDIIMLQGTEYSIRIECCFRQFDANQKYNIQNIDCDNLAKPVLDALKEAKVWNDDRVVYNLEVTKQPISKDENDYAVITIWEWQVKNE